MMNLLFISTVVAYLSSVTITSYLPKPVAIKIANDGNVNYKRFVNFYNDTFYRFYDCMVNCTWQKCEATTSDDYQRYPYTSSDVFVSSDIRQVQALNQLDTCYFSCYYKGVEYTLTCQRYQYSCSSTSTYQSVHHVGQAYVTTCISLLWSNPGEKLVYNSSTDNITECDRTCFTSTTASTDSSLKSGSTTSLPSEMSSVSQTSLVANNSTSSRMVPHTEEQGNSLNIPVIVGVVCGVGGALIVSLLVIFLVLKSKRARRHPTKFTGTPKYVNDFISGTGMSEKGHKSAKSSQSTDTINQIENGGNGEADMGSDGYYLTKDDQLGYVDLQKVSHSNTCPSGKSPFINGTISLSLDPDKTNKSNYDYIMVEQVNSSGDKDISSTHKNNYSLVRKPPKIPLNHPNQKLQIQTDNRHLVPTVNSNTLVDPHNLSHVSDSKPDIISKDNNGIHNVNVSKPQTHHIGKEDIDNYSTPQELEPNDDYNLIVEIDGDVPVPATQSTDVYAKLREDAPDLPTNPYNELGYHDIRVSRREEADQGTQRDATGYTNVSVGNKLEPSSESGEMELEDEPQDVYPV